MPNPTALTTRPVLPSATVAGGRGRYSEVTEGAGRRASKVQAFSCRGRLRLAATSADVEDGEVEDGDEKEAEVQQEEALELLALRGRSPPHAPHAKRSDSLTRLHAGQCQEVELPPLLYFLSYLSAALVNESQTLMLLVRVEQKDIKFSPRLVQS